MSEFPECNRRGKVLSQVTCQCFSNRIIHEKGDIVASLEIVKLAGNFIKAVTNHVKDGGRKVSQEELQERLEQCNNCQFLVKNRCRHMKCGCFITKKAKWRSESCPIGRWPKLEE